MKDSEVYLRAAELISRDVFVHSCNAIDEAANSYDKTAQRKKYTDLFCPVLNPIFSAWMDHDDEARRWDVKEEKAWRVLALLFMHQISKDEERS